jgi:hypothetical protein
MKIIKQNLKNNTIFQLEEGWFPPPGQEANSTNYTISTCGHEALPDASTLWCNATFCLFNVTADPCEHHDLAAERPDVVKQLVKRLADYEASAEDGICGRTKPGGPESKGLWHTDLCGGWPIRMNSTKGVLTWRPCDLQEC